MNLNRVKPVNLSQLVRNFLTLFLIVMVFELCVGGGGRFFEIGPVTVRMLFYLLAIPISLCYIFFSKKVSYYVVTFTVAYTFLIAIGILIGFINHNPVDLIIEDIKPLSFFYVLPFFSIAIKDARDIAIVSKVIKVSSLLLAILYIALIAAIVTGFINFSRFYALMEPFGEVMFRGETFFFYKGFLYLCIGFFFTLQGGRFSKLCALILLAAIVLTLTRGFILMVIVVSAFYLMFIYKNKLVKLFSIHAIT